MRFPIPAAAIAAAVNMLVSTLSTAVARRRRPDDPEQRSAPPSFALLRLDLHLGRRAGHQQQHAEREDER